VDVDHQNLDERTITNYVLGEICLVVQVDRADDADGRHADAYRQILDDLNQKIARHLSGAAASPGSRFAADLEPTLLRERCRNGESLLYPPVRASDKPVQRPYVFLPSSKGPSTVIHLYQIGPQPLDGAVGQMSPEELAKEQTIVRQLVNLVNWRVLRAAPDDRQGAAPAPEARVIAATPNWLTPATPFTCGGPAAPPDTAPGAPDEHPRFAFGNRDLLADFELARERSIRHADPPVVVAVLDTCPPKDQIKAAATPPDPRANWLLRDVANRVSIDDPPSVDRAYFDFLNGYVSRHGFEMPDHGLFATGIIWDIVRDVSPRTQVALLRVLDDKGTGDLFALASVLMQLPIWREQHWPGSRLVVNLSLVADVPVAQRLLQRWFPSSSEDAATMVQNWSNIDASLEAIHASLAAVVDWLTEQDVLVAAAAGNDNGLTATRPEPRYPAHYDSVLGVAAVDRARQLANYSNLEEEPTPVLLNGIATYGGNTAPSAAGSRSHIEGTDAIIGIFSSDPIPPSGSANQSGWAYWVGTSFATPIVSAVAANVWTAYPGLSATQVSDKVRGFRGPADPPSAPILDAFQE
jgi:hypothetical protein